jgi:hypothetical protein
MKFVDAKSDFSRGPKPAWQPQGEIVERCRTDDLILFQSPFYRGSACAMELFEGGRGLSKMRRLVGMNQVAEGIPGRFKGTD